MEVSKVKYVFLAEKASKLQLVIIGAYSHGTGLVLSKTGDAL